MGEPTGHPVVRMELDALPSTPYLSRRLVGALIDRGPAIKAVDSALLVSELVTPASQSGNPISIAVEIQSRRVVVRVDSGAGSHVDELTATLLDRLADGWGEGPPPWFEIALVRGPGMATAEEGELWSRVGTDRSAREELFARYQGLAGAVARRFRRTGEGADVDQVACMALVGAIDRFDPGRGVKFSTFAVKSVSGELKRYLRDTAWDMKVPRSLKEAALRVTKDREQLSQELGRPPEVSELATATGLTEDEVVEAIEAGQAYGIASLDAPVADGSEHVVIDTIGDEDEALITAESWWQIEPILEKLPPRDRHVLHLRFFEDMSQSEIAEILGVSQMQVSRILSSVLDQIKSEASAD